MIMKTEKKKEKYIIFVTRVSENEDTIRLKLALCIRYAALVFNFCKTSGNSIGCKTKNYFRIK